MRRRHLLLAGATAAITIAQSRRVRPATPADSTLRYVPNFSLPSLDPILGIPSSPHAYMVYDTLYGVDTAFVVRPQMAAGHVVEDEGRRWTIVLRDGLVFHDGEKVRAQDAVASIGRWMKRNTFGQKLQSVTDELSAIDDRRIVFRLNRPFPLLLAALANPANPAFVLPERLARTDPYKPIQDATGSGPFRFKADEFNAGSFAAYERHTAYQPAAAGEPSLTAGPKIVHFDRVEWRSIPDPATAAAALQQGEVDWYSNPTPEQIEAFRRNPAITILPRDFAGNWGHLAVQPPASTVRQPSPPPGVAAGHCPGRFHAGDRGRRYQRFPGRYRRVPAEPAVRNHGRAGTADRSTQPGSCTRADKGRRLQQTTHAPAGSHGRAVDQRDSRRSG